TSRYSHARASGEREQAFFFFFLEKSVGWTTSENRTDKTDTTNRGGVGGCSSRTRRRAPRPEPADPARTDWIFAERRSDAPGSPNAAGLPSSREAGAESLAPRAPAASGAVPGGANRSYHVPATSGELGSDVESRG